MAKATYEFSDKGQEFLSAIANTHYHGNDAAAIRSALLLLTWVLKNADEGRTNIVCMSPNGGTKPRRISAMEVLK